MTVFGFWFWLGLLAVIALVAVLLEVVEDQRAWTEQRRQRASDRETERVLREMEQRQRALQSVAEWKRTR